MHQGASLRRNSTPHNTSILNSFPSQGKETSYVASSPLAGENWERCLEEKKILHENRPTTYSQTLFESTEISPDCCLDYSYLYSLYSLYRELLWHLKKCERFLEGVPSLWHVYKIYTRKYDRLKTLFQALSMNYVVWHASLQPLRISRENAAASQSRIFYIYDWVCYSA